MLYRSLLTNIAGVDDKWATNLSDRDKSNKLRSLNFIDVTVTSFSL